MAKDDYFVLAYRILLYYYGCFKRKFVFDTKSFLHAAGDDIDIDYLTNSSKNHPDVGQRAAAKKELENGSLKRELDEVKEKIASLKKILK